MEVNGRNLDVERMLHEISLEAAKVEMQLSSEASPKSDDISKHLDQLFNSYVQNFAYLSKKTDDDIRTLLEEI